MILIAHRGNLFGSNPCEENKIDYLQHALELGYHVEIDLWFDPTNSTLYLGHDAPQYECPEKFIHQQKIWIHCKNIHALEYCKDNHVQNHYFFHDHDDTTLTSKGLFWTYPGKTLTKHSIAVMPEYELFKDIRKCYGICSDFVGLNADFFYELDDNGESFVAFQQIQKRRSPSS